MNDYDRRSRGKVKGIGSRFGVHWEPYCTRARLEKGIRLAWKAQHKRYPKHRKVM